MAKKMKVVDEVENHPDEMTEEQLKTASDQIDTLEERKELFEELFEKAEAYAKTNIELFKLKTADKLAVIVASLVARIAVLFFVSIFFLMINIGIAFWLGENLGHVYYGFFIVAGLYAFISVLLYVFRNQLIKNPIINSIISQILK